MAAAVEKRIEELKVEIPEAVKKCKRVDDLKACKVDLQKILTYGI
jgi:hypothetical protein